MCILAIQRYKTNVDKEKQYKYKDTKPIRTYIKVSKPIQLLCVKTKTKRSHQRYDEKIKYNGTSFKRPT